MSPNHRPPCQGKPSTHYVTLTCACSVLGWVTGVGEHGTEDHGAASSFPGIGGCEEEGRGAALLTQIDRVRPLMWPGCPQTWPPTQGVPSYFFSEFFSRADSHGEQRHWVVWGGVGDGRAPPGACSRDTGRLVQGLPLYWQPCASLSPTAFPALFKHFHGHLNLCSGVGV